MNSDEKMMVPADKAVYDLTLALIYLTIMPAMTGRRAKKSDFWNADAYIAWKGYNFDILNRLADDGYTLDNHRNKSLNLTDEGIQRAREILEQYGIADWPQKNEGEI